MVGILTGLRRKRFEDAVSWRLINSKYPSTTLVDDIASEEEFEALYQVAALTNPRIMDELEQIALVPKGKRPFGIRGANYAIGPFVHLNTEGSRFASADHGAFYCADSIDVAISETRYHQERYLQGIGKVANDDIQIRGLKATFSARLFDICGPKHADSHWYDPADYSASQALGKAVREVDGEGIYFNSVRHPGGKCYALFWPNLVADVIQTAHYNYCWDGNSISDVYLITSHSKGRPV